MSVYCLIGVSIVAFAVLAPGTAALRLPLVAVAGLGFGGSAMFIWAMLPNAIAYGEVKLGRRIEALTTGVFLLVIKISLGLGAGAMGFSLAAVGYDSTSISNAHLSGAIVSIMCTLPIVGVLICVVIAARLPDASDFDVRADLFLRPVPQGELGKSD
jgi:GPH family glycoside/pentoside/hexuronide:cation symporter